MPTKISGIDTKWWIVGGVAGVGIVYYVYHKTGKSSSSSASSVDTSIDPNTGLPYASESGGYSSATYGTTPGAYQNTNSGGYYDANGNWISYGSGYTGVITNAQWAQGAETYLISQGFDPITAGVAIGKYLNNQDLNDTEYGIVEAALAFEGYPPQSPGAPHQPTAGGGSPSSAPGAVTGLGAHTWGSNYASFFFTPVAGADYYEVTEQSGGTRKVYGGTTGEVEFTEGGSLGGNLKFPYTQSVRAVNAKGAGPWTSITLQSPGGTH